MKPGQSSSCSGLTIKGAHRPNRRGIREHEGNKDITKHIKDAIKAAEISTSGKGCKVGTDSPKKKPSALNLQSFSPGKIDNARTYSSQGAKSSPIPYDLESPGALYQVRKIHSPTTGRGRDLEIRIMQEDLPPGLRSSHSPKSPFRISESDIFPLKTSPLNQQLDQDRRISFFGADCSNCSKNDSNSSSASHCDEPEEDGSTIVSHSPEPVRAQLLNKGSQSSSPIPSVVNVVYVSEESDLDDNCLLRACGSSRHQNGAMNNQENGSPLQCGLL
mmetsp:Transcript_18214/g.23999  ORF Transcript_18214/g.23999 Transcript_18214/m.23999 type:complete len:274 (+) Transcript_18214:358-1179(+)